MEQVTIQDCGCIALPESVVTALSLKRGMQLNITLTGGGDAILITPLRDAQINGTVVAESSHPHCTVLFPPR
jgi:antitoxin component of MazEF toxin-antitoxin module